MRRSSFITLVSGLAALLLVVGCGPTEPEEPRRADPGGAPTDLAAKIGLAIDDATATTGADPTDIEVVLAERVTWRDGAIGCPEPDDSYTQALVDGYLIVLELAGDQLHYHGEDASEPFRCEDPEEPAEWSGIDY